MEVYIVFSMAKSGSTSIFKMLTDNGKLPAIHTHDGYYLTIHDTLDLTFKNTYLKDKQVNFTDRFSYSVKPYLHKEFVAYEVELDEEFRLILFRQLKDIAKIISIIRNPIDRCISMILHGLDANFYIEHGDQPECKTWSFEKVCEEYQDKIENYLKWEYVWFREFLKDLFYIDTDMDADFCKNMNFMSFKLESIEIYKTEILKFFNLSHQDLPWERNCYERKSYLFDISVDEFIMNLKEYIINYLRLNSYTN